MSNIFFPVQHSIYLCDLPIPGTGVVVHSRAHRRLRNWKQPRGAHVSTRAALGVRRYSAARAVHLSTHAQVGPMDMARARPEQGSKRKFTPPSRMPCVVNTRPDSPLVASRGTSMADTVTTSTGGESVMAKNKVQFQASMSLPMFPKRYRTEDQCRAVLLQARWPQGFVRAECGHTGHCPLTRREVYQCNRCKHQVPLTSGTLFTGPTCPCGLGF